MDRSIVSGEEEITVVSEEAGDCDLTIGCPENEEPE